MLNKIQYRYFYHNLIDTAIFVYGKPVCEIHLHEIIYAIEATIVLHYYKYGGILDILSQNWND